MYIVTKWYTESNKVEIVDVEIEDDPEIGYLTALNEVMSDINHTVEGIQTEIIDANRIEVYQKGYLPGKTLLYIYQICHYYEDSDECVQDEKK